MELDSIAGPADISEIRDLYETFSGTLAFDIGASGGWVANVLARHFDRVVACEPSVEPYELMAANVADNVIPLNLAVSQVRGQVEFSLREMSEERGYLFTGGSLPEWGRETGKVKVDAVTLDDLRAEYGQPGLVKIDTEGHEPHVVWGGRKTFLGRPEFVIEIHSADGGEQVQSMLEWCQLPYRVVHHGLHEPESFHWHNRYWIVSDAV